MDIFEIAMKMELDGKAFYLNGAKNTDEKTLKQIFITLADEEERHFQIFKNMKNDGYEEATKLVAVKSETTAVVRNVFREMIDAGQKSLAGDDARAVWTEALRLEERTEAVYREHALTEKDEARRSLWDKIADEEKNHVHLISNIISFLADPEGYAQSANYKDFMSIEGR